MSFRFRRRLRLFPGVRLNVSRSGLSASIGPRGLSVTVGKRGTYVNVGAPGTGLSVRERLDHPTPSEVGTSAAEPRQPAVRHGYLLALLAALAALVIALH
ncbi:MAG: DUF4236 domain-containing protein [Gemmatimonadaceae bacterium]|nr:DUF4236 domain-containing protein [Gemmatimonadaceae bacterium]